MAKNQERQDRDALYVIDNVREECNTGYVVQYGLYGHSCGVSLP